MAEPMQFPLSDAAHHAAKVFIAVTVPLLVLALITLVSRIMFKLRSSVRLGWDDGFIVLGSLLAVADWALLLYAIAWCADSSRAFMTMALLQQTIKLGVVAVPAWICSMACIKISVCCLLLRFQHNPLWRMFLYVFMGFLACMAIGYLLFDLLQCIPLAAVWDWSIVGAKCVNPKKFASVSNTIGVINITTDVILSLFPLTFLLKLRRPVIEKALILVLMGMGLLASAASIAKAVRIKDWVRDPNDFSVGFSISTWTCVEMLIGITAACLPSLKSTVQKALTSMGLNFNSTSSETPVFFQSIGQRVSPDDFSPEGTPNVDSQRKNTLAKTDSSNSTVVDPEKGRG